MPKSAIIVGLMLLASIGLDPRAGSAIVQGDGVGGLGPYFAHRIRFVDTPLIAEELGLDEDRRLILEQIVLDYQQHVDRESQAAFDRLDASDAFTAEQDPAAIRRDTLRKDVRRSVTDDAPGRLEQVLRDSMRSELAAASFTVPPTSPRTRAIRAWQSEHEQQWGNLVDSIDSIRDPREPGHWDAVFRALRRRNSPWQPMVYGESLDLARIVHDHWGRESEVAQACYPVLRSYDQAYDEALRRRDEVIQTVRPVRMDAEVLGLPGPWIDAAREEADARAALAQVNERYIDEIASCMPSEDSDRFELLAGREMYPDAYRPTSFQRLHRHLVGHAGALGLSSDQLKQLDAMRESFDEAVAPIQAQWVEAARRSEPEGIILDAESAAMLRCYGFMGPLVPEREQLVGRAAQIRERMDDLDEDAITRVKSVVGRQIFDRVPASTYQPELLLPPGSPARGGAGGLRVVYLRGAGDRTGLDDTGAE